MTDRTCFWPQFEMNMLTFVELVAKSEEEIKLKIENYYKEYPSAGYGTYIGDPKFDKINQIWKAIGSRERSCD